MRFQLRSLMFLLAIGPPILAGGYWLEQKAVERYRKWEFDPLIQLIQTTIKPNSWEDVGGPGTIDQFETNCCVLLVSSEPETIEATDETNELQGR